ncbi:MAG: rubrerythrin family protein [Lachnospiraceae bacterium]|jgi:rubrerythrin|nr:rubrerythrin family protein [Lachnospiraceae bacterium]
MDFKNSETKDNLMRAFAGESQARNRYTFSAYQAKKEKLPIIEKIFLFTAEQEKEHAEIFYRHLKELAGDTIQVDGGYPVDLYDNVIDLLKAAQHNEYQEHDDVYKKFGEIAREEGFLKAAASFELIAGIEKIHGDRFGYYLNLMEQNKLFVSEVKCGWICLNCGYIYEGEKVPEKCPVCQAEQGYFIRVELSPYGIGKKEIFQ